MMTETIHKISRFVLHLFWLLPIKKKRIMFTAYKGAQFSCNPKYIFIELYNNHKDDFEFVWCLNNPEQLPKQYNNVKVVGYKSLKYVYYQITSRVVILNHANPVYIPLRKTQLKINTWHGGGAYKRVSMSAISNKIKSANYKTKCEIKDTDIFISSSKKFTEVMFESQSLPKKYYLEIGMPRNDLFFEENTELQKEIKSILNIDSDIKTILYAPTYRGVEKENEFDISLDVDIVLESLKKRFGGKWELLLRTHINTLKNSDSNNRKIIDVTSYPDMQELLLIADVLITDYSSSIWDFALTGKPAFLFTPDLENYQTKERGFYTPIEKWQYNYAINNQELKNIIINFDSEKHKEKIAMHLKELKSFEDGRASKKIIEYIYL